MVSNDEVTTQRRRFIICCDMTKGRLCHVPAFFGHSKGPSSEPQPQYYTICCTVVAIWNYFWSFTFGLDASEPSSVFAETMSPTVLLTFWINSPKPCRRCIWIILSKPRRRFIYLFWWRSWPWKPFRRTSIIHRVHRYFRCFISNLHVSGFSSCRII